MSCCASPLSPRRDRWWFGLTVALCTAIITGCGGGDSTGGGGGGGGGSGGGTQAPPLGISTSSLPEATKHFEYSVDLMATGGTPPYAWYLAPNSNHLPTGMHVTTAGRLSGSPSPEGDYLLTFQVEDTLGRVATRQLALRVLRGLFVSSATPPDVIRGRNYSFQFEASGGTPPYVWSLAPQSFPLPVGLTLSDSGLLGGECQTIGSTTLVLEIHDSVGNKGRDLVGLIMVDPLVIATESLAVGNVGIDYLAQLFATGGRHVHSWSLTPDSGPLPTPLTVTQFTGEIRGIPEVHGVFPVKVQVRDSGNPGQFDSKELTLVIENKVIITTESLPLGVQGAPFSAAIRAVGGATPYTFRIVSSPPPGLSLDPNTGVLSGSPEASGRLDFTVEVTDSGDPVQSAQRDVALQINPPLALVTERLPDAVAGVSYSGSIQVNGGVSPYLLELVEGGLPAGIRISSSSSDGFFLLGGTPEAVGESEFSFEIKDSFDPVQSTQGMLGIRVNERLRFTEGITLARGLEGQPYSSGLSATGGVPPYTWSATGLPRGLSIDPATGEISGIPEQPHNSGVSVTVRDNSEPPQAPSAFFNLAIVGELRVGVTHLPRIRVGVPFRVFIPERGGVGPYTWSLAAGSLPMGLQYFPADREIRGTPTSVETQTFTLRVSDSDDQFQQVAERELTLEVVQNPGRNDSIATATPIGNGAYHASISPYADPGDTANPDSDFYRIVGEAGDMVTVEIFARRWLPVSSMDSVIEILDEQGVRYRTCQAFGGDFGEFVHDCLNDDHSGLDSRLRFLVPGEPGTNVTFYLRVLDWTGHARPDFTYNLTVTGASTK